MLAEAVLDTKAGLELVQPTQIDPSLSEVLLTGREDPLPKRAQELVDLIGSLGLPSLAEDRALLVGFYYFSLGAEEAVSALRIHFGDDVEDRLGITFEKRGTLEKPGMNSLLGTYGDLPEFRVLEAQLPRMCKPVAKKPTQKALVFSS